MERTVAAHQSPPASKIVDPKLDIEKVVSGGQTGVDRAALDAAQAAGVPVGGWCPRGRRAEDGVIPARYPLKETPAREYAQRTAWNVRDSDATLVLTFGAPVGGTTLTIREADERGKPYRHTRLGEDESAGELRRWLRGEGVRVLNVAGPRASEAPGIYEAARSFLSDSLHTKPS